MNSFRTSIARASMSSIRATRMATPVRSFVTSPARFVAVGDKIPEIPLYQDSPGNEVNLAEETASGKSVIIGVPGAFSPGCSLSHVPGYIKNLSGFNEKNYKKLFVVAVNDAFVQKAWGELLLNSTEAGDQIKFLADPAAKFNEELGLTFDASKFFGNERSKRYALLVEDGKITQTFVEPDNTSVDVSAAEKVLAQA